MLVVAGCNCAPHGERAGADDLLFEPVDPASFRARVRTWLLRASALAAQPTVGSSTAAV